MNWLLWVQIAEEIAAHAPQLIDDFEKLWHDAVALHPNHPPMAQHHEAVAAAVAQAKGG